MAACLVSRHAAVRPCEGLWRMALGTPGPRLLLLPSPPPCDRRRGEPRRQLSSLGRLAANGEPVGSGGRAHEQRVCEDEMVWSCEAAWVRVTWR